MKFLTETAAHLYKKYREQLSSCCLVFPNRRAGLFFSKYLYETTGRRLQQPSVYTINEFMGRLSGLITADNISLVYELYKVYSKEKKSKESFDDFFFWGEMLLNDFDETDRYLADAKQLFRNLEDLKNIEDIFSYLTEKQIEAIKTFWKSFVPEKKSKQQKGFIEIWSVLYSVYSNFRDNLKKEGIAYEGMIFRDVAEKADGLDLPAGCNRAVFIGFNALNRCEHKLFSTLLKKGVADFYWDYDRYYIDNEFHEAGLFMRDNLRDFPCPADFTFSYDVLGKKSKTIEITGVPSRIGQAKLLHNLLRELHPDGAKEPDRTAVVLADESLLMPVLYSLPQDIGSVNITMGYPLKDTPVYSLVEHIIALQKNARKNADGTYSFYYKNVISVLNHQYMKNKESTEVQDFIGEVLRYNKIYIPQNELDILPGTGDIFVFAGEAYETGGYLMKILQKISLDIQTIKSQSDDKTQNLEQEYIFKLFTALNRLNDIIQKKEIPVSTETFLRQLKQIMQNMRIPFTGEPLEGVQVMGILETRGLDFGNVIILSVNEGVLPADNTGSSFIPYNLRKGFGLPTSQSSDAVYAYYFYRLIQRAQKVSLLYNTETDKLNKGEMSRFLYQLKYEKAFNVQEKNLVYDIGLREPVTLSVSKTSGVMERLMAYTRNAEMKKYLSPTAVNSYIDCGLRFYFRYVAGLEEAEKITEEVDPVTYGNLLHHAMNVLYRPFMVRNTKLDIEDLEKILIHPDIIDAAITAAFKAQFFHTESKQETGITGRNILIFDIIKKYIIRLIETDKQYAPFEVLGLEEKVEMEMQLMISGAKKIVCVGGTIDRIDKTAEGIRIIDYKTGSVKNRFPDISSLFAKGDSKRSTAIFQTMLYCLLFERTKKTGERIIPGIYWLKSLYGETFDFRIVQAGGQEKGKTVYDAAEYLDEFKVHLGSLLAEIFNPGINFEQASDREICKFCTYTAICERM